MNSCPCGCSGFSEVSFFSSGETDFVLCEYCNLVRRKIFPAGPELDEIYRQAYALEKILYSETDQESGDFAVGCYSRYMQVSLPSCSGPHLDYGAGSGALVEAFRMSGVMAEGIEFSADARAYCSSRRGIDLRNATSDWDDGHFSRVSMIEVIEHLTDLRGTLNEIHRLLVPGGRLFVTTPNRNTLRARVEGGFWREARKKFHLFLFDARSLKTHLELAGFCDIRFVRFPPLQRPGMKFRLFARFFQILGLGGTLCVVCRRGG